MHIFGLICRSTRCRIRAKAVLIVIITALQTAAVGDEGAIDCRKRHTELSALKQRLEQAEEARARVEHRNAQLRAELLRLQAALAEAEEKIRALTSIEHSLEQPEEASEIP